MLMPDVVLFTCLFMFSSNITLIDIAFSSYCSFCILAYFCTEGNQVPIHLLPSYISGYHQLELVNCWTKDS